jgi:hypothetical protein
MSVFVSMPGVKDPETPTPPNTDPSRLPASRHDAKKVNSLEFRAPSKSIGELEADREMERATLPDTKFQRGTRHWSATADMNVALPSALLEPN